MKSTFIPLTHSLYLEYLPTPFPDFESGTLIPVSGSGTLSRLLLTAKTVGVASVFNQSKEHTMKSLVIKTSKFSRFINDPRTKKAVQFGMDNWREIASVAAVALIMEDVDTAADLAQSSFTLEVMTAITEGVI